MNHSQFKPQMIMFLLSINQKELAKEEFEKGRADGTILTKDEFNAMKAKYEAFIDGQYSGEVINNPGYFIDLKSIEDLIKQDDDNPTDKITGLASIFGINKNNEITIMLYAVDKDNKPWGVDKLGAGQFFMVSDGYGSCCTKKMSPQQKNQSGCIDLLAFFETSAV